MFINDLQNHLIIKYYIIVWVNFFFDTCNFNNYTFSKILFNCGL